MIKETIRDITIECVQGDIAKQSGVEAIVNAANAELKIGGGVAGAIHRAAGPGLEEECRQYAPIEPGEAVITGACDLSNDYVIHCLGPVYGRDEPGDTLLASCYENALDIAEDKNITSVAFPAISTGAFGYPIEPATRVALNTVFDKLPEFSSLQLIRFVLFSGSDREIYEKVLSDLKEDL